MPSKSKNPERKLWAKNMHFTPVSDVLANVRTFNGVKLDAASKLIVARIARNKYDRERREANAQTRLAHDLGMHRSMLGKQLARLEEAGLIRRVRTFKSMHRFGIDEFDVLDDDLMIDDKLVETLDHERREARARWARDHARIQGTAPCPDTGHGEVPAMSGNRARPCPDHRHGKADSTDTAMQRSSSTDTSYVDESDGTESIDSKSASRAHERGAHAHEATNAESEGGDESEASRAEAADQKAYTARMMPDLLPRTATSPKEIL